MCDQLFTRYRLGSIAAALTMLAVSAAFATAAAADQAIDFTRDVRPILADNCFLCHGPDPSTREADLRLDRWESSDDLLGAADVVVPGEPDASELVARITADDADVRMPPADSGKSLTPKQIETLIAWIAQGAEYKRHWAFVPPRRPEVPRVSDAAWVQNPIDAFVLARLERQGLKPSPRADRTTLLRRLSLDLIGLPPTLDETDTFLANDSPAGYDAAVERLLASPHFGERWARVWLDAARYADSDGFEKDKPREVWMYRDWVVGAMNDDMPYNQFVVEQVAGDLLPSPKQDDLVATGFLRNSMVNQEGGIDPEQFRMEAMFDRLDAIGKAVLGLTVQCAQCHSHKYDPLTQTDYYRMFAMLNNCHEAQITVYTDAQQAERERVLAEIARIENELRSRNPGWQSQMAAWEAAVRDDQPEWIVVRPALDGSGGQKHYLLEDGSVLAAGYAPSKYPAEFSLDVTLPKITAVRLELMNHPSLPHGGPGRSVFGLCALTEFKVAAAPLDKPGEKTSLKIVAASADVEQSRKELEKIFPDPKRPHRWTGPIEYANDGDELTAWGIDVGPGRSNVPRKAVFVFDQPVESGAGVRLTFTLEQNHGETIDSDTQTNNLGRFRFAVTSADGATADPLPADVRAILAVPAEERTAEQTQRVFSSWRTTVAQWREANDRIEAIWRQHPRGASQLVLQERDTPRSTHRLDRGDFLKPAEEVSPGVPEFLHPLADEVVVRGSPDPALARTEGRPPAAIGRPAVDDVARSGDRATTAFLHPSIDDLTPDRLAFARWLVDRRSPTTARSIVNRIWQAYFGTGLVTTAEDLGTQGDSPSHPELLDWLAVELMDHDWSLKHVHRQIVTSATYQQSSAVTPQMLAVDPDNRLLERGPRFRVDAEMVRDVALSASGLIDLTMGGPSVYPPAPEFLFQRPASFAPKVWDYDTGPDKYRRALYTFRYRSVPYPALQNFDAPIGDVACARRVRSNTPLAALTTLNEALFLECARALAARTVADGGTSDAERITYAMRRCLARPPQEAELQVLAGFLDRQRARFGGDADPLPLISDTLGELARDLAGEVPPAELAAWTALARVVLNLDETVTKE